MKARIINNIRTGTLPLVMALLFGSCIHEYPHAVDSGGKPVIGQDPTTLYAKINLEFDLQWETLLHQIWFTSRDGRENTHRFIIEVKENDQVVCRDIRYISEEDFSLGKLSHTLSTPLSSSSYDVAVWYDRHNSEGIFPYEAEGLHKVGFTIYDTTDALSYQCGYACEKLDLREYGSESENTTVEKTLNLEIPLARFELVATDVNEFIEQQKAALEQGDRFTARVNMASGASDNFNLYTGQVWKENENLELEGWMRLPFAEYEELKIAEGAFFCYGNEEARGRLTVINSAQVAVVQTDYFTFPVTRGAITVIKGEFLTHPVDGFFSVNHIWDGEIEMDL